MDACRQWSFFPNTSAWACAALISGTGYWSLTANLGWVSNSAKDPSAYDRKCRNSLTTSVPALRRCWKESKQQLAASELLIRTSHFLKFSRAAIDCFHESQTRFAKLQDPKAFDHSPGSARNSRSVSQPHQPPAPQPPATTPPTARKYRPGSDSLPRSPARIQLQTRRGSGSRRRLRGLDAGVRFVQQGGDR